MKTVFPATSKRELELRKKLTLKDEENKQLREALSFYADESKYADRGDYWKIVNDEGETARKGLEGMKSYEKKDGGGRNVCKWHGMLRCGTCSYTSELEEQNKRYRGALDQIVNIDGYFTDNVFDASKAYELIDLVARKALEESE